jgi:hypothetical protein
MSRVGDFLQHQAENPSMVIKVVNWIAALLGIGTFLQLVNLTVGVLSAMWLAVQIYGWFKYERPRKYLELQKSTIDLERKKLELERERGRA